MLVKNIQTIFNFFSNHFELILYINLACIVVGFLLFIAVQFSDAAFRSRVYALAANVFVVSVITAQGSMMFLSLCVYWANYQPSVKEKKFVDQIILTTQWAQLDTPLYYIQADTLRSMTVGDRQEKEIFKAKNPLREYHFSPNGKYLLAVGLKELYLVDIQAQKFETIDSLFLEEPASPPIETEGEVSKSHPPRGAIHGVRWAPDSQKFCYETSLWTPFSSQERIYVYSIPDQRKIEIKSPARRISSLYWDQQGDNLYYLYNEAKDTSVSSYSYEIKIFRIPVEKEGKFFVSPSPQFAASILSDQSSLPLDNLKVRGIEFFLKGDELSFERSTHKSLFAAPSLKFEPSVDLSRADPSRLAYRFWKKGKDFLNSFVSIDSPIIMSVASERGKALGIDQDDYLYYIHNQWFRKRLFKIPREPLISEAPRYPYKGGEPVIYNIRWLPGGRYVILEHKYMGVFILDPYSGKIGNIVGLQGEAIGWFEEINSTLK